VLHKCDASGGRTNTGILYGPCRPKDSLITSSSPELGGETGDFRLYDSYERPMLEVSRQ